jgi:hypothetical protein
MSCHVISCSQAGSGGSTGGTGEAWEKKMTSKQAEHDNVASAEMLISLGLVGGDVAESWEHKNAGAGADLDTAGDIFSKLGLADGDGGTEAWEVKK